MNKKTIIFLLILSLTTFYPQISSNATAKAGAACTKAGITSVVVGKKFTCIKSGKKLVWNKGVMVANPSPTTTPTVSKFAPPTIPKSFPELEGNLSGIIYGAWLKGSNQIASGSSSLGKVQIFSSPSSDPGNPDPILPLRLTSQLYSNFSQPKNVYVIEMNDGDGPWAQQIFNKYSDVVYGNVKDAISQICSSKGACRGAAAYRNSAWDGILVMGKFPGKSNAEDTKRLQLGMTYSHEYYHTVQWFNGRNNSYNAPTWLLEGSAIGWKRWSLSIPLTKILYSGEQWSSESSIRSQLISMPHGLKNS